MFEAVVRRGILTTVAALIITVVGVLAALRIPVQMIPDLEVRTVSVQTSWPGATPQDIEKEILIEQEEFLRTTPYLQRLEATATSGSASIELDFPFGVDMTETLIEVQNALNQVPSYPENVDEPRVIATSFSANAFMYLRVEPLPGNPRGLDMDMMRDFIEDNVRPRMSSVPGVSQVTVGGGAERQIRVQIDPQRLAGLGLTVRQVRDAIRARNRDVSGGEIESGKRRYLLRTVGRFRDLEELRSLVVERRGDTVVRLADVAEIELDHSEIRQISTIDGAPVIGLQVLRETGSNVIDIKYAMLERIDAINRDVLEPGGMRLKLTAEDAGYVEASIRNVWKNLAIGALFATLVMYAFLRSFRATLVGVMGVPLCTIAAFIGLLLAGRTINVISLAGVAFAIGMTLDNSIVVIDSIERERRRGLDRFRAAVAGVQRVWPAVLASTLTTILVFIPVLFIVEEAGQLYSDIAIAISASILASMGVAITLIPTASARLEFDDRRTARSVARGERLREALLERLQRFIATPLRRAITIGATVVAALFVIFVLTPPAEYLPEGEEARVFASMNPPPGYNLETMHDIGRDVQDALLPSVGVDPADFESGVVKYPALRFMIVSISPDGLRVIAQVRDPGQVNAFMEGITALFESFPGMRAFATRGSIITSNDGGTRSINLDISGPTLDVIYETAQRVYRRSEEVLGNPRIQSSPASLALAQPLVEVRPDWDRAAELGMSAVDVGLTVAALTDGAFVDEFFLGDDKIDIYLYGGEGEARVDELAELPVHTPRGAVLPLAAIATITETVDTSTVRRINGQRTVTLNVIPPESIALETGVAMVRDEVLGALRDSGGIPASVNIDISGASDQLDATRAALAINYPVALVIVFLLMVAIFNHWGYPLLIMTTIPVGIAGGIVGLVLMNLIGGLLPAIGLAPIRQPFDMITMLGFLILMGTVVNNPILIVDRAMRRIREDGLAPVEAVNDAVEARLRPIAMSTLTTICGLSPLVLLPGEGTELYRGVGAIVLFGILGAAVVSLTMLPALTVAALNWRRREN